MRSRPSIVGATLGRSAGAAPAAERRGSGGWSARPAPRLGGVEGPLAARPGECWAARLARSGSAGGRAAARLPVSILVLGAAAVFFEHIRKIGCMHSLERSAVSDAFFEDPNSLKKVPCPSVFDPPEKYISLIVPAYNEEHRLPEALTETLNYLKRRSTADKSFSYEVLIVDDGSTDRTSKVAFGFVKQHKIDNVRVLLLGRNHGKGEAVRKGMLHSRGELLLMLDADGATKVTDLEKLEAQNSAIYPSIAKEVQLLVKRGTAHLLRMSHLHKHQLQMQVEVQVEGEGEGEEEGVEKEEEEVQVLQVQVKHLELKEQKGLEHKEEEEEEEEGWLHY